ncbi:hypothetical protein C7391_0788 [Methanimicrococcus blatticola]|uniref:Uncharacterized protein n=1 Tax=Methanimicrococcus blatticola TaxID=91560 RepID=A0A484F549_9EURY|nr:hypothetical protein C7391_0788 [Methanimicrococcus blatticola]
MMISYLFNTELNINLILNYLFKKVELLKKASGMLWIFTVGSF